MSELKIQKWPIDRVKPYEMNAKIHDEDQIAKIAKSITEFGWDQPIVVDRNGVIIKGHGRRMAALKLGFKEVPVLVRDDLTDTQVRAARLADNRVALSGFDTAMLRDELASLDFDLKGIFDEKEIDFSMADLGEINTAAFIDDIDKAVRKQEQDSRDKSDEIAAQRVPLAKLLGFKDVATSHAIYVNRFMAMLEAKSGLEGEAALIDHMKQHVDELAE